ncbi:MAG: hypothetical protein Q8N77_04880 [Nanoarchaeota archaeon]|nr:hypothetical protein [Nanoarchaeota archaeon]
MPDLFKKAPKQLRIEGIEGVEIKKKFATAKVIKWGIIIWIFYNVQTCMYTQPSQNKKGEVKVVPPQTIEQVLPSSLKHYDSSQISFKKSFLSQDKEVYRNGVLLGVAGEAYVLADKDGVVTGYLNSDGLYNALGQCTGSVYKGDVFDLNGSKLGSLKGKGTNLESIISNDKEIMKVNGTSYVIISKNPSQQYSLIGVLDNYQEK